MFDPADLFIRPIDKLTATIVTRSPDGVFDAVVLVRQLLMDKMPLIHRANKNFRLKLLFTVNPMVFDGMPAFLREEGAVFMHIDWFSPWIAPHRKPETVDIGRFLAQPIMLIDGAEITVRDIIDYLAHYAGAVHSNDAKTPASRALEKFSKDWNARLENPIVLRILVPIIQIIVADSYPLYQAIVEARPRIKSPA
jgi:hypothetical protein